MHIAKQAGRQRFVQMKTSHGRYEKRARERALSSTTPSLFLYAADLLRAFRMLWWPGKHARLGCHKCCVVAEMLNYDILHTYTPGYLPAVFLTYAKNPLFCYSSHPYPFALHSRMDTFEGHTGECHLGLELSRLVFSCKPLSFRF